MNRERDKPIMGTVLEPEDKVPVANSLELQLPPDTRDIPLHKSILRNYRYWGVEATLKAYRKAIESGVHALNAQAAFYEADRKLDMQRAQWEERDKFREAARREANMLLQRMDAEEQELELRKLKNELELQALRAQLSQSDTLREIDDNSRAAELAHSKRLRREEERRLQKIETGDRDDGFEEKRKRLEEAKKQYEQLMTEKAKDIEAFGSEEMFPDFLITMYEQLEDELAERMK